MPPDVRLLGGRAQALPEVAPSLQSLFQSMMVASAQPPKEKWVRAAKTWRLY